MSDWKNEFGAEYEVPAALDAMVEAGTLADQSWHNDVSPSFTLTAHEDEGDLWDDGLPRLWVNHPDPKQREHAGDPRFLVLAEEALYEGEDLDAALAALRAARPAVYVPVEEDDVRGALRGLLRLFREIDAGEHDSAPEIVRARAVLGEA